MGRKYDKLAAEPSSFNYCNESEIPNGFVDCESFFPRNSFEPINMKQMGRDSDAPYLPQEIITNILKRLPVKSLIRFQCVCRHWGNLIKNPSFIADHLQQSSHQNPSLLLESNKWYNPLLCHLRLMDCGTQVRELRKAPLIDSLLGASIIGSCNGLLCVQINKYKKCPASLLLWNPATTEVRHVPRTRTDCYPDDCVTGFGFSPIINDYMIVRIYAEFFDTRVEVFSLSSGLWKEIDIENLKRVKLDSETVSANGIIFWSGIKLGAAEEDEDDTEEGGDDVEVIVSFDIAKELFTLMPRPDFDYHADEKLTVYENKLAILWDIWDVGDERADLIDLWVMEEDTCAFGEGRSWNKIYTSSPCSDTLTPMTIWRNEIVCKAYSSEEDDEKRSVLYLMNVTTNEVKRFAIPYCGHIYSVYNYAESLVSVGNNYIEES